MSVSVRLETQSISQVARDDTRLEQAARQAHVVIRPQQVERRRSDLRALEFARVFNVALTLFACCCYIATSSVFH